RCRPALACLPPSPNEESEQEGDRERVEWSFHCHFTQPLGNSGGSYRQLVRHLLGHAPNGLGSVVNTPFITRQPGRFCHGRRVFSCGHGLLPPFLSDNGSNNLLVPRSCCVLSPRATDS